MNEARPHATAWFPPLPPAVTDSAVAVRVSPGPGQRGVEVTKSMFREPMMQMCGFEGCGGVSLMPIFAVGLWWELVMLNRIVVWPIYMAIGGECTCHKIEYIFFLSF